MFFSKNGLKQFKNILLLKKNIFGFLRFSLGLLERNGRRLIGLKLDMLGEARGEDYSEQG